VHDGQKRLFIYPAVTYLQVKSFCQHLIRRNTARQQTSIENGGRTGH
jgi:hypothetical protein